MNKLKFFVWLVLAVCPLTVWPQETAEITGRVVDETNQPITGAQISVIPEPGQILSRNSVITDRAGRFRLFNLTPGAYRLRASRLGYIANAIADAPRYQTGEDVTITLAKGGVITGQITDGNGAPIVGVNVRVERVAEKGAPPQFVEWHDWLTDDRGVYRVYGLPAGRYYVFTGSARFRQDSFSYDAPVYYPAGKTQAEAATVNVSTGAVTGGVNLNYFYQRGRVISGQLTGLNPQTGLGASVSLLNWQNRQPIGNTSFVRDGQAAGEFSFNGLADGEYLLLANAALQIGAPVAMAMRRVTVKGQDVSGVILQPQVTGSLSGKLVWDKTAPPAPCENIAPPATPKDTFITAYAQKNELDAGDRPLLGYTATAAPNAERTFTLAQLFGGAYRLRGRFPEEWFVREATLRGTAKEPDKLPAPLVNIKSGVKADGLIIYLAPGAASLKGRLSPGKNDKTENWHLFLVPAGKENAEDAWLYRAIEIEGREFNFANVAPGRYWLLARPSQPETAALRAVLDAAARAKLRQEAETNNVVLDLTPCQRVTDYVLRYRQKL